MKRMFLAAMAITAAFVAVPATAAPVVGTISIGGPAILNNADASQATAIDFIVTNVSNGSAPGAVGFYNGTGAFSSSFCNNGACGTINDIASLALGAQALSPFYVLTNGVTFSLTNISFIDRSVAGILSFKGSGTFTGNIGGVGFDPTPGIFSFSAQGGNLTSFSATTTAVPEPATWALMLLGFGGIGMAMRRRRQPVLAQVA